ncbi:MAG TPA: alpha/beta fold hydrolase [Longimicrobiales bacterium]|nr:alpha/beta fold hydrolase [Longimicrobiales bacterium]
MMRVLLAAFALMPLSAAATPAPAPAPAAPQLVEREVRVDDRMVRALCTSGPREALLLQRDGAPLDSWRPVLERLEGAVGACAYERTRVGGDAEARGWFELLDEMRRVHAALGFQRGYVLVGHGLGGSYARLYAVARPAEIAGLVLVDPAHEDMPEEARHAMPEAAWADWMRRRSRPNADGLRESEIAQHARASRLPDMPVTVITATRREAEPEWDERFLYEAARRVHASLLEGITRGRHIPASRSGPEIHLDEPDLVARETTRLVRLSRGSNR